MPELLVNDWSGRLATTLDSATGVGGSILVVSETPELDAAYLGFTARARVGDEIVSVTLTAANTWTIIAREAEDADRYPQATWPVDTPVDLVLTSGSLEQLIAEGGSLPATIAYEDEANVFTQEQSFQDGITVLSGIQAAASLLTIGAITCGSSITATGAVSASHFSAAVSINTPQLLAQADDDDLVMMVKGATGQTANLTEWRNSVNTVLASVNAAGQFVGDGSLLTGIAGGGGGDVYTSKTNTFTEADLWTADAPDKADGSGVAGGAHPQQFKITGGVGASADQIAAGALTGGTGSGVLITSGVGGLGSPTGAGGVGGLTSLIGGAGASSATGGLGGGVFVSGGAGGAPSGVNGTGGRGGTTTINAGSGTKGAGTGTGGRGGSLMIQGGAGAEGATGGQGGGVTIAGANGGLGTAGAGGTSGLISVTAGDGGGSATAAGASGGTATLSSGPGGNGYTSGGAGGSLTLSALQGGTYNGPTGTAGAGGAALVAAGTGGSAGAGGAATGGAGGLLTLRGGNAAAGTSSAAGGNAILQAGTGGGSGANGPGGDVRIIPGAGLPAGSVRVCNSADTTTYFSVDTTGLATASFFKGDGSQLTNLSATALATGTVPLARIGSSGTPSTTTFLRGDNTWATPAGGGGGIEEAPSDSTYYVRMNAAWESLPADQVTSVNGQIGDVLLAAGDIGAAEATHFHDAADIVSGTIPVALLGVSGTPSATTYLRGDNTWTAVPVLSVNGETGAVSLSAADVGAAATSHTHLAADLPATIAYKDASNTFTGATQTITNGTGSLVLGVVTSLYPQIYFDYAAASGGDVTSRMGGTEQVSFGFNNSALFGGTLQTTSGRMMYFYDRPTGLYRGGWNASGDFIWGPSATAYSVALRQPAAGTVPLTARGAASQTANLQEWQDSAGTPLATVSKDGRFSGANFNGPLTTQTAAVAGTTTLNLNTSNRHYVTFGAGNTAIALSNDADGDSFTLFLKQDGVGGRTVTSWPTGTKWQGGTAPTLTTTAGKIDVLSFVRLASGEYLGTYALNF